MAARGRKYGWPRYAALRSKSDLVPEGKKKAGVARF